MQPSVGSETVGSAYTPASQSPLIDLSREFEASRGRVVACVLLDFVRRRLPTRLQRHLGAELSALIVFVSTAAILALVTLLGRDDLRLIAAPLALAAGTVAAGLYSVHWIFEYTIRELDRSFDNQLTSGSAKRMISRWLRAATNVRAQVITISIIVCAVNAAIAAASRMAIRPFPIYASSYVAISLAAVALGQGVYWAFVVPTSVHVLARLPGRELGVFPLNPSRTPCLVGYSRLMSVYALSSAAMSTMSLLTCIALRPAWNSIAGWSMIALLGFGYLVTTYVFAYPHVVLAGVVRREKFTLVCELQRQIARLWAEAASTDAQWDAIRRLGAVVAELQGTRYSVVNFAAMRSYAASLATPTIALIAGRVDWAPVLHWMGLPALK